MDSKRIIMNFSLPPSADDLLEIAADTLENLPDELADFSDEIDISCEELPDEVLEQELELDDPFELLALYRSGKEIAPGIERKNASENDTLILFRRPILDMWCETGDDLCSLVRSVVIEEIGRFNDFSDDEIHQIIKSHQHIML